MLRDFFADLRYTLRGLRRSPAFTIVAVLALALCIGANTAVVSVIDVLLNFTFPVEDSERVAFVFSADEELTNPQGGMSPDDFLDLYESGTFFEQMVAASQVAYNLTEEDGEPERVQALAVTGDFFPLTGKPLALGRGFRPEDAQPGGERVLVLSHAFWQRRFASDPGVIGKTVSLDQESYTIIGVGAEDFFFPQRNTLLWTPLALERGTTARDQRTLFSLARLKPGLSPEQATAEANTVAERLAQTYPDTNRGWSFNIQRVRDNFRQGGTLVIGLLYGAVSFVLLIACANIANLLLARATAREREIAMRTSLGAGRLRLMRQLITESLVLALLGGAFGLVIGFFGVEYIKDMLRPDINVGFIAEEIALDGRILSHTVVITLIAGVLFGLAPAIQLSRTNLVSSLKDGGRGGSSKGRRWTRGALVLAEVTMALALLGVTGAMVRAFEHIYATDPGFDQQNLLTMQLSLPERDYSAPHQWTTFYRDAADRIAELPGVVSATSTTILPLSLPQGTATTRLEVDGYVETDPEDDTPNAVHLVVGEDYFETLDIDILQGRALDARDRADSQPVAVVTEAMARRYWPDSDPLGRRFRLAGQPPTSPEAEQDRPWISVVGVIGDVDTHSHSMRNPVATLPQVFLPLEQSPARDAALVLRSRAEPEALANQAREAIWSIDRTLPVGNVLTMNQLIAQVDTQNIFFLRIVTSLATIALVLAAIGIYGVISFAVSQRTREIGVRMALGANPLSTVLLVVRQAAILTIVGSAVGIALSFFFVRLMATQLDSLQASNAGGPATFVAVVLVLLAAAGLASLIPARRAVRVDPVIALRDD